QRLKEEVQRQAKAAADAEAKRKAAEAEQQRLAALNAEIQRQAKAAAEAEATRKAAEVEQQRLAAAKAEEERKAKAESEAAMPTKGPFEIRRNMKAADSSVMISSWIVDSVDKCELRCKQLETCTTFTFERKTGFCFAYSRADLVADGDFDSGIR